MRKISSPRATRRRTSRRRKSGNGFSFFLLTLAVLAFALAYIFAGDLFLPQRESDMVFSAEGEIIVSFLDVGQGDAILVRTSENAVLIDAGEHRQRDVVLNYLAEAGISRLDYVVATHPHSDHIGGLVRILRDFEIGHVVMPDVTHNTDTFENFLAAIENNNVPVKFPVPGDRLRAGIIDMTVISPSPELAERANANSRNINDASIVLRLAHGQTSFLFTGDAEAAAENWILSSGQNIRANVLNVGHHGSRTSTTENFLAAVAPAVAVIQSGTNNQHGHPHPEVIERLAAHGVEILNTAELGTIRIITDGQSIFLH